MLGIGFQSRTEQQNPTAEGIAILHAGRVGVGSAAETVHHVLGHQRVQLRISVWVWDLGEEDVVDLLWRSGHPLVGQDDEPVGVGKAALLKW